jgi:hypothetical protein
MSSTAVTSPAAGPARTAGRAAASVRIGMFTPAGLLEQDPETARAFLAQAGEGSGNGGFMWGRWRWPGRRLLW